MPLSAQFRTAAQIALADVFPIWLALPLADWQRVTHPNGPGSYSISIEPHRGSMTWMAFHKKVADSQSLTALSEAIVEFQPELNGYLVLPGSSTFIGDVVALISVWCQTLEIEGVDTTNLSDAIEGLLERFSDLLDSRSLTQRITTALSGLELPADFDPISLDQNVTLRGMTSEEIEKLSSHNIAFGGGDEFTSQTISTCIVLDATCRFNLEPSSPKSLPNSDADQDAISYTRDVLRALHILKAGRAGVYRTTVEYLPNILPRLAGRYSSPSSTLPFASLKLEHEEVDQFKRIFQALRSNLRDELRIASDRLVDAERRLSAVDSLLDAAIGLEVLLNPMDSSELAFRVALNYAFLEGHERRRERYDQVRNLQKIRNRVVHGGLNLQSPSAHLIKEHADLGKACLRDAISCFLLNSQLSGNRKLDADFWLDRIIPSGIDMLNNPVLKR